MLRIASIVSFVFASTSSAAEITTLAGKKSTGTFTTIVDANAVFMTADGPLSVPVKEMALIDFNVRPFALEKAKYDEIELTDGTLLRVASLKIAAKSFVPIALPADGAPTFDVPMEAVFSWQRSAEDPKHREEWKKLLAGRGKRDLFVIKQADGFSPVPGTILGGDTAGTGIDFERESDNQKVNFKLARASGGLVFNQPPRGVIPTTLCKLHDAFGNILVVHSITGGESLTVKTVSGAIVNYPNRTALAKLDFTTGNMAYLSNIEPVVTAPTAIVGEPNWTYLKDQTPDGPGFKLANIAYARGLWIAPDVTLAFKLNADYREFKAVLGVDDSIAIATSAVRLTIEADGKQVYSEIVARKDKPRELTLDVKNVKVLKLSVDGEGLFLGNQVNLADARLQK